MWRKKSQAKNKKNGGNIVVVVALVVVAVVLLLIFIGAGLYLRNRPSSQSDPENSNTTVDYSDSSQVDLNSLGTTNYRGVNIQGKTVTIIDPGEYSLTGKLVNGQVRVETNGVVALELDGVEITHSNGPAILINNIGLTTIVLKSGTQNSVSDGGSNLEHDAAIFSVNDLEISGTGSLRVKGNNEEGIASDGSLTINDGYLTVAARDDALNAQTDITIRGGTHLFIGGGDGIDSNNTLTISGGTVITQGSTLDMFGVDGGLDADEDITIGSGAIVVATGVINATPTDQSTKYLLINLGSNRREGGLVAIMDGEEEIMAFTSELPYQQIVFSSDKIREQGEYTVYLDGTAIGHAQNGFYADFDYTPGTLFDTVRAEGGS